MEIINSDTENNDTEISSTEKKPGKLTCPVCHEPLPLTLVFSDELKKHQCAKCTNWVMPTRKSVSRIKLIVGLFGFVTGIPLGAFCTYLWFGTSQPLFAVYFLFFGTATILGIVTLYAKARIKFFLC